MNTYIGQNDIPPFPKSFDTACYVMSILYHLNAQFGIPEWTHQAILDLDSLEMVKHDLDPDQTIEQPQKFVDDVVGSGKVLFRGKFDASYNPAANEFEILVYHYEGANFDHFVAGNGYSVPIYDPWRGGSESVAKGQIIGKRIYQIL